MSNLKSTIRIDKELVVKLNSFRRDFGYKSVNEMLESFTLYFEKNGINPRTNSEPIVKQLSKTRNDLYALLRALEKDYFLPHYRDFNLLAGKIMTFIENQKLDEKEVKIEEEITPIFNTKEQEKKEIDYDKIHESIDYLIEEIIKDSQMNSEGFLEIKDSQLIQLKADLKTLF